MQKPSFRLWNRFSAVALLFVFGFFLALSGVFSYTRAGVRVSAPMRAPEAASAATSSNLNMQARLYNANGSVVPDGYYNIEFKLYDQSSGGSALWTEAWYDSNGVTAGNDNRVRVVNGYMSVPLGTHTAFGAINWDQDLWISINVGGTAQTATPTWDGEMSPRIKLTAVPYAFQARQAEKLLHDQGTYSGQLDFDTLTDNRNILLPDENGTICLQGSTNCGFVETGDFSLQGAYDGGNTILTTDGNDIDITLADTATDANFTIDIATGSTGEFKIQSNGTDVLQIGAAGQLQLDVQGSSGGILIGGDVQLYRSSADDLELGTGDSLHVHNSDGDYASLLATANSSYLQFYNSTAASEWLISSFVGAEADPRFLVDVQGALSWGDGSGAVDTNLYRGGANLLQTDDSLLVKTTSDSATAFQVQDSTNDAVLTADTSNNRVVIGDADNTSGANTTLLVLDSGSTANTPTGVNGGMFYDSTTNKFRCYQNGGWVDCVGSSTLQGSYDGGNTITTTDARDIDITLADTATDANLVIDIATGSTGELKVQSNGTDVLQIGAAGQLQLDVQGNTGGILLGGDANLYRAAANFLWTDDNVGASGYIQTNQYFTAQANSDIFAFLNHTGATSRKAQIAFQDDGATTWLIGQDISGTGAQEFHIYDNVAGATRLSIDSNGQLQLAAQGSSAGILIGGDTNLYRSAADSLRTDDAFFAAGLVSTRLAGTDAALQSFVSGQSFSQFSIRADGLLAWGDGTGAKDTNLYRSAADTLRTDSSVNVQQTATNALVIQQNSAGSVLLTADTSNMRVSIGGASGTLSGRDLEVADLDVTTTIRVGDATNGFSYNDAATGAAGKLRRYGTAREAKTILLSPEFAGATLTGDGTNNTGAMTSDFCSGTSRLSINTSICSSTEEHNYYSWTSQATNDYDVWVKWKVPTDFSGFDSTPMQFYGWRTGSTETVQVRVYRSGTLCDNDSLGTNGAWAQTTVAPATSCNGGSAIVAGDELLIRVTLSVGTNNNFARIGEISINYLSSF